MFEIHKKGLMEMIKNKAAPSMYTKAKTTVWWDMTHCPVPDGYDASLVGPCIDRALQKLGYSGRLSITAFGDLKHIPDSVVLALSSTGIVINQVHSNIKSMFSALVGWRTIRPPANFMLISDLSGWKLMSDPLNCLQEKGYNILVALEESSDLINWKTLLADSEEPLTRRKLRRETYALYCTLCKVDFNSCEYFTAHLTGKQHELEEYLLGPDLPYMEGNVEETMTLELEENHSVVLKQLHKIYKNHKVVEPGSDGSDKAMVLWDIDGCLVPPGYDACLVGPRVELMFKKIGFSGSLTIIAIGELGQLGRISPEVLRAISSSGILVKHATFGSPSIMNDVLTWVTLNPPPAKIMLISSIPSLLEFMSPVLKSLQKKGYRILPTVEALEALPADNDVETRGQTGDQSVCFICTSCDLSFQSYDSFYIHITSEEHRIQAFRTCYYYRNQEPGSGTRYAPAVKKLSKEGLNISSFLLKLMMNFRTSELNKAESELSKARVGSSCLSNTTATTTVAKKQ